MNTKLFLVVSGIILISATGSATAESITLSSVQLDAVTAGSDGDMIRESYSSSQVTQNNDGTASYSQFASARSEMAPTQSNFTSTDGGVQIVGLGSLPNTLIPFAAFVAIPW